ncbi:hypothetical protein [Paraburkholderia atlantica]|uniref:hypothetical protein n=1 Tax=Paraburkholderia atlantica TaxID=2654982 RepID=UPI003D1B255E
MSAKPPEQDDEYRERTFATHWAENNPIREGVRQAVFHALCRIINNDAEFWWSTFRLHWRTAFADSTVSKILGEFEQCGLIEWTGRRYGKGGTKAYRLNYRHSVIAYPDTMIWEDYKATANPRKLHRQPVKLDDSEVHRHAVKLNGHADVELHRHVAGTSPRGGGEVYEGLKTKPSLDARGSDGDAPLPLAGEASNPAAPDSTAAADLSSKDSQNKSGGTAVRGLQRAAATASVSTTSRTTSNPREDAARERRPIGGKGWTELRRSNMEAMYWLNANERERVAARSLLGVLPEDCRANANGGATDRMAKQILTLARAGCQPDDIRRAYRAAQRALPNGKPHWASLYNAIDPRFKPRSREADDEREPARYRLDAAPPRADDAVH